MAFSEEEYAAFKRIMKARFRPPYDTRPLAAFVKKHGRPKAREMFNRYKVEPLDRTPEKA